MVKRIQYLVSLFNGSSYFVISGKRVELFTIYCQHISTIKLIFKKVLVQVYIVHIAFV